MQAFPVCCDATVSRDPQRNQASKDVENYGGGDGHTQAECG